MSIVFYSFTHRMSASNAAKNSHVDIHIGTTSARWHYTKECGMESACINNQNLINRANKIYQQAVASHHGDRVASTASVQELEIGGKKYALQVKVRHLFLETTESKFDESKLLAATETLLDSLMTIPNTAQQAVEKEVFTFSNAAGNPCSLWLSLEQQN